MLSHLQSITIHLVKSLEIVFFFFSPQKKILIHIQIIIWSLTYKKTKTKWGQCWEESFSHCKNISVISRERIYLLTGYNKDKIAKYSKISFQVIKPLMLSILLNSPLIISSHRMLIKVINNELKDKYNFFKVQL